MRCVDNAAMRRVWKEARDERGVVLTWLLQITLVLVIVGTVLFDAGSITWNYFGVDSRADDIALELSDMVRNRTTREIEDEAKRLAKEAGGRYVRGSLQITEDRLSVEIRRKATTLVVGRIGAISDWGRASATGSAPTS
jgi:hypothetical protein